MSGTTSKASAQETTGLYCRDGYQAYLELSCEVPLEPRAAKPGAAAPLLWPAEECGAKLARAAAARKSLALQS